MFIIYVPWNLLYKAHQIPIGDAPTASEWWTILLATKVGVLY